jgi:hypothetical protein
MAARAAKNIGDGRPLRVCDLCGGVDDHPRHTIAGNLRGVFQPSDAALDQVVAKAPEDQRTRLVRELMDTTSTDRHLQCCRDAGCPNGTCGLVLMDVDDEVIGAELLNHLDENGEAIRDRVLTAYEINSIDTES